MLNVHSIHLLKRPALGLIDEEENNQHAEEAASGEDVSVPEIDRARNERREEGDEEVPGPVRCCCDPDAARAESRGIEFAADCPDHGPPTLDLLVW